MEPGPWLPPGSVGGAKPSGFPPAPSAAPVAGEISTMSASRASATGAAACLTTSTATSATGGGAKDSLATIPDTTSGVLTGRSMVVSTRAVSVPDVFLFSGSDDSIWPFHGCHKTSATTTAAMARLDSAIHFQALGEPTVSTVPGLVGIGVVAASACPGVPSARVRAVGGITSAVSAARADA